ncbi:MAG: Holliday junction branch migration protein RuvA [Thermaerobacter sp.]|nr:Holliday junction branch migration protein RuvA [Thermaerobacter sp.]
MIVELRGDVTSRQPGYCVLDVGGVGYGVEVPRETEQALPGVGQTVRLFTHLLVREDGWRLVGFATREERQCFVDALSVSGVGVKGALALLSHLGVRGLKAAVKEGRWQQLKEAPGVGPKIAQRAVLELSSKWKGPGEMIAPGIDPGALEEADEAMAALLSLGFSGQEAALALKDVPLDRPAGDRVRDALRRLDRRHGVGA